MKRRSVEETLSDVDPAVAWVDELAGLAGLDDGVRFAMQVCIEEALSNLVTHGRPLAGAKHIDIGFEAVGAEGRVVVTDACVPYDVTHAEEAEQDMTDMPLGGLGLRLLRSFAQDLSYDHSDGRNVLSMVFRPHD